MKIIRKLLFKNQNKKQLLIAFVGSFLGLSFLLISVHYLIKVNEFGEGADILGPNTLIVQKKVSTSNTLNLAKTDFSTEEIIELKKKKFILDVEPVISNNFDVLFSTNDPLVPRFSSDVFIQTVNPNFLDIPTDMWKWEKGDSIVPIILPRDFLVMLNTFMSASGIPQVSDELAKDIRFRLRLTSDSGKREFISAKIIGFTNEVASILVPKSFMNYGNENFSNSIPQKITQIMISSTENEFGLLENYLIEHHLESKNAQVLLGRLKSMVGTLIMVVLAISVLAVFLSSLVLIQYMQLLMTKNSYEIRTLLRIGYPISFISKRFLIYFTQIFSFVMVLSIVLFFLVKLVLDTLFMEGGLYIDTQLTVIGFISLMIIFILFIISSYITAKKGVSKEF
ncbi:MAG: hypothetical protein HYU67_12665 [Flavobacteriia bacterium]|nr:hypothetical protein [Flavobacteriia bacterium]